MTELNREDLEDIDMCLGVVANAADTPFHVYQELAVIQTKVREILDLHKGENDNGA